MILGLLALFSCFMTWRESQYKTKGIETRATITHLSKYKVRPSRNPYETNEVTFYNVGVNFQDLSGQMIEGKIASMTAPNFDALQEDAEVRIVYLPDDPRVVFLKDYADQTQPPPFSWYLGGTALVVLGLWLFAKGVRP